jgi:Histidine kinase-, DNA gyrase B-, and HSP90-like ATPase
VALSLDLLCNGFDSARILVADRGDGIPPEALGRIFEPFYRVTQAQEHKTGGTGLGLSIAQRIAVVHGGHIQARNREGGGLEMEISLPMKITAKNFSGTWSERHFATGQPVAGLRLREAVDWPDHLRDRISDHGCGPFVDRGPGSEGDTLPHARRNRRPCIPHFRSCGRTLRESASTQSCPKS